MKHVHLILTEEVYEALRTESFKSRRSYGEIVRDALLHKNKSNNGTSVTPPTIPTIPTTVLVNSNGSTDIMDKLKKLQEKKKDTILSSFINPRGELDPDNYV